MIKGVNKRIIEINYPNSPYFDKAVFYLKPSVRELPGKVSLSEANKLLASMEIGTAYPRRHVNIGKILIPVLLIAAISAVVLLILI